ncbi:hypothetical protein, partial [Faecalibaculum rodentium]|uniref:hypothetical protein n=2 Tax=Faecalibaculum rodentium TaxID=1702221 RepID=UPI00261A60F6
MTNNIGDSYSFRKIPEWFCKTRSPVSVKPEGPPFRTFHKKKQVHHLQTCLFSSLPGISPFSQNRIWERR